MTIEKRMAVATNSALNLKSLAASKGAQAPIPVGDKNFAAGTFSALLSGLGVGETGGGEADLASAATTDALIGLNAAIGAGGETLFSPQAQMRDSQVADTAVVWRGEQAVAVDTSYLSGTSGGEGNSSLNQQVRHTFSGQAVATTVAYIGHGADAVGKLDFSSLSTQAAKDKLQSEYVVSAAEARSMVDSRSIASHSGQKAITESATAIDSFRPTSAQMGFESRQMSDGVLSELRHEEVMLKPSALGAAAAAMTFGSVDLRSHASFADAVLREGTSSTAPGEINSGTFWVSGDVKNAEMTLHGVGEVPVEVSISLHGKQTHVSFRVDEDQARTALADNGPALKDMLLREGLELSTVSVGPTGSHLGSGADKGQDHRPQREFRSFRMDSEGQIVDTGEREDIRGRKSSGLDVFV